MLTHVLFGKGKVRSKTTEIANAPTGSGCFTVRSMAKVPKKQTLNKALLKGVAPAIRGKFLNWKLT